MRGDYRKLQHWRKLFENGGVLVEAVSAHMAKKSLVLISYGFATETDPYGKRWKKKKRPDGRMILRGPSGRLRGGWRVRLLKKRFVVFPSVDYAAAHQDSRSKRLPRRMMVPSRARGLPPRWKAAFRDIALRALRWHFGRR